jgi:hypothetical protein
MRNIDICFTLNLPKYLVANKKPHSSPKRKVGSHNLLTITFLPSKGIGERISMGMITEREGMSINKKGIA